MGEGEIVALEGEEGGGGNSRNLGKRACAQIFDWFVIKFHVPTQKTFQEI